MVTISEIIAMAESKDEATAKKAVDLIKELKTTTKHMGKRDPSAHDRRKEGVKTR